MADTTAATTEPLVPFFKKRSKGRPATTRIRETSPIASSSTAGPSAASSEVVVPTKRSQPSLFVQGTAGKRKKRPTDDAASDNEDPSANPLDVKWSSLGSKARLEAGMELEAEDAEEAEEELRRKRRRDENDGYDPDDDKKIVDGTYRGQKGYQTLIKKRQEVPKAARVGPQKGSSTIRTVTLVDYQPDVCKDYKETGFCGFGDTCKFLHDRGTCECILIDTAEAITDTFCVDLQGWQLDKLAEKASKQVGDAGSSDSDSDEEDVPWACFICRKPYTDPVVTRCSHYFCSACAIKRFAKTPKCAACGTPTGGIFNRADKIIDKMKEKQKAKEEAEAAEAEGVPEDAEPMGSDNGSDEEEGSD